MSEKDRRDRDDAPAAPEPGAQPEPEMIAALRERFGGSIFEVVTFRGEWTAIVRPGDIHEISRFIRDHQEFAPVFLADLCGVHWMDREFEYEVVYLFHSFPLNQRVRLKCRLESDETISTISDLFPGADWHEREAYDMVGVRFDGHPDLRRILMPEDYDQFPLRRDFPVKGY